MTRASISHRIPLLAAALAALLAVFLVHDGAPPAQAAHAPAALAGLTVTPGPRALNLTWTAPGVRVDGYDVHYTTMSTGALADDAESGSNQNPSLGWVDIGKSDRAAKAGIGGLDPGQEYRVRVRAYNYHGIGPWAALGGAPIVWSSTLTVHSFTDFDNRGCSSSQSLGDAYCGSALSPPTFSHGGRNYMVVALTAVPSPARLEWVMSQQHFTNELKAMTLYVGSESFPLASATVTQSRANWDGVIPTLTVGETVRVALVDTTRTLVLSPEQAARTVTLSASAERVREGDEVTITATVMREGRPVAIQEDLEVLLSIHLGTAEAGDVGTLERISIGKYSSSGSATIQTNRDGDGADETFAVLIRWIPKRDFARVGDPRIVWVTITEGGTAPPEPQTVVPQLQASGGDETLYLTWRDAATGHDGYIVQYKLSSAADQPATTADDPETGWVDAGHTGRDRSLTIADLTNWVDHDVRVRLTFSDGTGPWSDVVTASPQEPTTLGNPRAVTVTISDTTAEEGDTVTLTATLDQPAPREGATVQFWAYGSSIGGTVNGATVWRDYRLSPPDPGLTYRHSDLNRDVTSTNDFTTAPITIRPGQTTATATLEVQRGHGDEGTEGIRVYATANVPDPDHRYGRWALTSPTVTMTIYEQGQSPTVSGNQGSPPEQETAPQPTAVTLSLDAATVGESAGSVTVTATLDAPAPDGGVGGFLFAGADGTASEGIDFTMPLEIFIPGGQRSATATITITGDDEDEANETVVLSAMFDLGTAVLEDTVTLTISDDDTAGVSVAAASPLAVDEGATATYTVVLDSQPTADVTISATSGDTGAVSVSPASHTFTSSTWSTPVTFTVRGVADSDTNDESVGVSHSVTSADTKYTNALVSTVSVSVSDTTTPPPQQQDPPANQAPTVASAIAGATIVHESGTKQVSLSGVFADADNDALTVTAASSDTTVAAVSVAADSSSLTLTARSQGTATITVTADDGAGGTVEDTFTVRVKTAPTVALAIGDVSLEANATQEVSLSGVFSDLDGDALTITTDSTDDAIANAFVFQDTLTVTAFAEGSVTITVTAEDADGNRVSDAFEVTVTAPQTTLSGIAARYDANGDGAIDGSEYQQVKEDWLSGKITQAEFLEVVRVHLSSG